MIKLERLKKRIEQLAEIGRSEFGGITRLALSEEDRRAQELVTGWMKEAGMTVRLDAAGNLIGRKNGRDADAKSVMIGSHIDSAVEGGKYDGTIGVIAGIEVVQHFMEEGIVTLYPIEVVAFCEEEGSRFHSGLFGSRALTGQVTDRDLEVVDDHGVARRQALLEFGLSPDDIFFSVPRKRGDIAVYLEMHIEQGPILDNMEFPVGIVTDIAGPVWGEFWIDGQAGHAGTVPMRMRHDAFLGASELAVSLEKICLSYGEQASTVGTVGRAQVFPGGSNVVPGRVHISIDIRDILLERRTEVMAQLILCAKEIADRRGLQIQFHEKMNVDPVHCSPSVVKVMREESSSMNLNCLELVSGSGHDAQLMASITEMGMIFVRCKDGISHNPGEHAEIADIQVGTQLLARVSLRYAMGEAMVVT